MPRLVVVAGPDRGRSFPLTGPAVAGRAGGLAVQLLDDEISRRHFELTPTAAGGFDLRDLGSGNGTRVNGRTVAACTLRYGDRIDIGKTGLEFLPDEMPGVLSTVAADAGSALLKAPSQAGTPWLQARLANLAVLYEAAFAVSNILDVDELLGRILELLLRTADADHAAAILRDPETDELVPKAERSRPGADGEPTVSRTVVEHVLKRGEGVLIADAAADARFGRAESVARHRIREVICVPMKGRHGTVGALFLDTTAGEAGAKFTPDHLQLAVAVAHQAALAVEETRYYAALLQSERLAAVGQTIAGLSHHIKNIMHGVKFGGDMVRAGLAEHDAELLRKGWKLVEKNQAKIDGLILDMLSYSKDREAGFEPTDVAKLTAEVLDGLRGRAKELNVELILTAPAGLPPVPCDPDGIARALLNVAANALDAAAGADGARVTVTVFPGEIVVEDTGPGVPPELRAAIFQPFVSTKGSRGTGLGLPAARKTLREHGGDLTVEAGPGGVFRLRLGPAL